MKKVYSVAQWNQYFRSMGDLELDSSGDNATFISFTWSIFSSIQVHKVIINIASSKLSSLLFIDGKFSCLISQSSMYTKVFHNIPFKSHILRAFLLNIVIYIDCANEIQETLKMAWWDLEPLKLHDRLAYWPISVCMVNPLKNRV